MYSCVFIAIIGVLVYLSMVAVVPCMINKTDKPLLEDIKKVLKTNRQLLLATSLIVGVTILLAVKLGRELEPSVNDLFNSIMSSDESMNNDTFNFVIRDMNHDMPAHFPPQLRNLLKLSRQ